MSETYLLQFQFGLSVCVLCVCPFGFVRAITCTFVHEFQNNLAQF